MRGGCEVKFSTEQGGVSLEHLWTPKKATVAGMHMAQDEAVTWQPCQGFKIYLTCTSTLRGV